MRTKVRAALLSLGSVARPSLKETSYRNRLIPYDRIVIIVTRILLQILTHM